MKLQVPRKTEKHLMTKKRRKTLKHAGKCLNICSYETKDIVHYLHFLNCLNYLFGHCNMH